MSDRDRDFAEFVATCSAALQRTAFLICVDRDHAQDAVQEALYRLYLAWPKVQRSDNVLAYARRAVMNAAFDAGRRPWRRERATRELPETAVRDEAVAHADRDEMLHALRELPPRRRACIVLRYYEGLSVEETAAALGDIGAQPAAPVQDFTPMPGVDRGEAALQPVSEEEALRRCRVQWATVAGRDPGHLNGPRKQLRPGEPDPGIRPGSRLRVWLAGGRDGTFDCFVPGDSQPSAAALAAAKHDSVPTDPKEQLRRCSTQFWHDITGWRIVSSSVEPGVLANLIAVAPSGRFVAHCSIAALALRGSGRWLQRQGGLGWKGGPRIDKPRSAAKSLDEFRPERPQFHLVFATGVQTCQVKGVRCVGWLITESDRMPRNVARLRVQTSKRTVSIPVRDGWFTVAVGDLDPATGRGKPGPQVTAYDAKGRYLGRVPVVAIGMDR